MSRDQKAASRFEAKLTTIVNVAEGFVDEAGQRAAFNILQYLIYSTEASREPKDEAVAYLQRRLSELTSSQRRDFAGWLTAKRGRPSRNPADESRREWIERVGNAVNNPRPETINEVVSALPNLSIKQRWTMANQLTARRGRPVKGAEGALREDDSDWWEIMRIGAEVSRVMKEKRQSKVATLRGAGPYESAIDAVAGRWDKRGTIVKDYYSRFKRLSEKGLLRDDDPRFSAGRVDDK